MRQVIAVMLLASAPAFGMSAFLVDQWVDGMNRTCVYESPRGKHYKTVRASQMCPISISV